MKSQKYDAKVQYSYRTFAFHIVVLRFHMVFLHFHIILLYFRPSQWTRQNSETTMTLMEHRKNVNF